MDITMSLQPHGWLDVMIYRTRGEKIEIPVSFLSDAIHEIASKTSSLGIAENDAIITMQTEPGEYRFKISKVTEDLSLFQLFEMSDNFSSEAIEEGTLLITEEIKTIRLLRIIHRELTKMKDLGMEGFKERWNSDFPINAYNGLSETIHKLK